MVRDIIIEKTMNCDVWKMLESLGSISDQRSSAFDKMNVNQGASPSINSSFYLGEDTIKFGTTPLSSKRSGGFFVLTNGRIHELGKKTTSATSESDIKEINGTHYYIHNDKQYPISKKQAFLFKKGAPNGIAKCRLAQGPIKDCIATSVIKSIILNRPTLFLNMIDIDSNNQIKISLYGEKPVLIDENTFKSKGATGDPLGQWMEYACIKAFESRLSRHKNNVPVDAFNKPAFLSALTGTKDVREIRALKLPFSKREFNDLQKNDIAKIFEKISAEPQRYVAIAMTRKNLESEKFVAHHAFSIAPNGQGKLCLINSQKSRVHAFEEIVPEEFYDCFSCLMVADMGCV
jgi:hypothetical protein